MGGALTKTCKKCNETKPLPEGFYAAKRNKDGRWGTCKECCKTTRAKWRLDHPEASKGHYAKWKEADPEKAKTINRASVVKYQQAHPERVRATNRVSVTKWALAHPEANRVRRARRRALKLAYQGPNYTPADVAALLVDQHDLCAYCGVALNGKYHVDHIAPLSQGGGNGPDNIALACAPCNLSKADKSLLMWAMFLGRRP